MSKQDRQGVRTATDIERKYNFGKSFAEVQGLADDARKAADDAKEAAEKLDNELTSEEILNRLTNNGELQGLYRGDDGDLYVNGEFIKAKSIKSDSLDVEDLFAEDINMTGKFQSTAQGYLPPTIGDATYVLHHLYFEDLYPLPDGANFDLNGDGVINENDVLLAIDVVKGKVKMEDCAGAEKRPVTICIDMGNPEKAIRIYGTNMWGTEVEMFIGSDVSNSSFVSKESMKTIIQQDEDGSTYRIADIAKPEEVEYFNPPMILGEEYRTTERWNGKPVYTCLLDCGTVAASGELPHSIRFTHLVSFFAECNGSSNNAFDKDSSYYFHAWANSYYVWFEAGSDVVSSGSNVYATLKYTKD
jgi:hypothetical protein